MSETAKTRLARAVPKAVLTLAVTLLLGAGSAWAQTTRYLGDGAIQNSRGGWDLPKQGTCPVDLTKTTRPDCLALRLVAASSSACTSGYLPAGSTSWSTGVCNDLVNTTQVACQGAPDRLWNAASSTCAIVMKGDDRNSVTCMKHNGTWVTTGACTGNWIMPNPEDSSYGTNAYGSGLLTGTRGAAAGTGDQCLRCHNKVTQYNGPRVRDTEDTLFMGHKNMSRPVKAGSGLPWGGPPFSCTGHPAEKDEEACVAAGGTWDPDVYHSDDTGNVFDWAQGKINVGAASYALKWIYGDWLAALPRAIYADAALADMSYSCGRCHTTGWTSDGGTTPTATKEPEFTFPGITWPGSGTNGQVKLGGGVAGDANNMASWDQWGITCTRCHSSAVSVPASGPYTLPFSAPANMSTHHSNLTAADFPAACSALNSACSGGRCSSSNCAAAGGTWYYGYCTDPRVLGGNGQSAAATKTACETGFGLGPSAPGVALGTWITPCSDNNFATQATCVSPATWNLPASTCSVAGLCNDPAMTTALTCTGTVASGPLTGLVRQWQATSDIISCVDAGGKWTGSYKQRGQTITSLCMNCHRQENKGFPVTNGTCSVAYTSTLYGSKAYAIGDPGFDQGSCVAAGGVWTDTASGVPMYVGAWHSTVTFPSHPHSNQFLNSPHGKFTGGFNKVATGKFLFGSPAGEYQSFFMNDGEAANTGNGCTGCHEVHTSVVAGERPFREECTECHTKNLNLIQHPKGIGTPFEKMATEPFEACVSCHMPGGAHLFRINVDKDYSTFPLTGNTAATNAIYGALPPNTAADGSFTKAVWNDLDAACGQCHGGGSTTKATTGGISANSATLTVASTVGFTANEKIRVTGAGSYYYDEAAPSNKDKYADLDSYIKSVDSPTQLTLAGKATKTVAGAAVVQNAVKNGAAYISKVALASYAKGIHDDKPFVSFTVAYGANGATVNVDASATKCSGSAANCNAYAWSWGDGTPDGSGVTASHAYAPTAPSQDFIITLTATQYSVGPGTATQKFTAYPVVNRPTAAGNCVLDYTAWTATCTNTGTTPDAGYQQLVFDWGDGTVINTVNAAPWNASVVHTFLVPGNYKIKLKVVDTLGQESRSTLATTVSGNFAYFTISGKIFGKGGSPALGAAQIQVKKDGTLLKSTMSAADGTYSTGNMKPGTYTLTVTKSGYTFTVPAATVTIGPSKTPDIWAIAP
jgi:hypothetical protein